MEQTAAEATTSGAAAAASEITPGDDGYFVSYEDLHIHELMLKDTARMAFFAHALDEMAAAGQLIGKTVLDVGSGTGVLSMMAAKRGAARVIAVEASPGVAELSRKAVADNGLQDIITVVNNRVEELVLGEESERPDVLISEWMGFYLLHEGMLHSVIWARDNLLKPGGLMLPSSAVIYAAPAELTQWRADHIDFWSNKQMIVDGLDMSSFAEPALRVAASSPASIIMQVPPEAIIANPQVYLKLDLATVSSVDLLAVSTPLTWSIGREATLHAFVLWFDVFGPCGNAVMTCSPAAPLTHWKQTVIHLPGQPPVTPGDSISCEIAMEASPDDLRHYTLNVDAVALNNSNQ